MRVVPVLDVLGGVVVRAAGGRRSEYRPWPGRPAEPVAAARRIRAAFGLSEIYVADLDALAGAGPAFALYDGLHADGFRLWVDAGVRDAGRAAALARAGVAAVVLGLETLPDAAALAEAAGAADGRAVFSLDLRGGRPLAGTGWGPATAEEIAARAVAAGVRRLLVLDLAAVGGGGGTGTEELCGRLAAWPGVAVAAGGGVRGPDDLRRLARRGVGVALVASALSDGRLTRADVEALGLPGGGQG